MTAPQIGAPQVDAFGLPPLRDAAWHAARAKVVGGSEIAALFDCQPAYALSKYALWCVKSGRIAPPEVTGERPKWGLRVERAIAEGVMEEHGWKVRQAGWAAHPSIAGMGCTLDFLIDDHEDGPGVLETKNVDWLAHKREWSDGEPPVHILLQHQHQLACTGFGWGAVAALVGGNDLMIYKYQRRDKLISDIERRVLAFWQSIADNKPPPVDGSDSAAEALKAMYPAATLDEIDLSADNELPELCAKLAWARDAEKTAKADASEARNRILAKVGEHKRATCSGWIVKAPEIKATTYTVTRKASRSISVEERTTE